MKDFLISVILPVYNTENCLAQCIDSILAQTYIHFELLLIDDGSSDDSGKICDAYAEKDPRVKVFHQENCGVSSARNKGLELSTGEWICFCDADDIIKDDYLEQLVVNTNDNDLVVCGFEILGATADCGIRYERVKIGRDNNIPILKFHLINGIGLRVVWSKLFKRDIISRNHLAFCINQRIGEDTTFLWTYIASCKQIQFIEYTGYCYRMNVFLLKKYYLSYGELLDHIAPITRSVSFLEQEWGTPFENNRSFIKQFYYGLFVKSILSNHNFIFYLKERKKFIDNLGKEKDIRVHFMTNIGWNLFLGNIFSASLFYGLKRIPFFKKK